MMDEANELVGAAVTAESPPAAEGTLARWRAEAWRRLKWLASELRSRLTPQQPEPRQMYVRLAVQLALEKPTSGRGKALLLTSPTSAAVIREAGLEFARALARDMGRRVLLIEADFGHSREAEAPGLAELLVHGMGDFAVAVRATGDEGVWRLPSGAPELVPASFGSGRHQELLERACAGYDVVLLLGSPVLREQKWLLFGPLVDHSLLLALEGETFVSELEASVRLLTECKAAGVGVVLTRGQRAAQAAKPVTGAPPA
jgi:Mrp family chromosome partitioning ATPase